MPKNPKRDIAVQTILEHPEWKAGQVADHIGLTEEMTMDRATDYIRQVRKSMRKKGQLVITEQTMVPEAYRLEDVKTLFRIRQYDINKETAKAMLLMHCYWSMRLYGNYVAVIDTMRLNDKLKHPLTFPEIERVCNLAQERGFDSWDPEKNAQAQIRGFVNAGINYTNDSLYHKFNVQEHELNYLKTIERPHSSTNPQGAPE